VCTSEVEGQNEIFMSLMCADAMHGEYGKTATKERTLASLHVRGSADSKLGVSIVVISNFPQFKVCTYH